MTRIAVLTFCLGGVAAVLTGCAEKSVPLQPVSIVGSDFCQTMTEKLTWDVKDTRQTIRGINRLNAKYDSKCGAKPEPTS